MSQGAETKNIVGADHHGQKRLSSQLGAAVVPTLQMGSPGQ